MSVGQEHRGLSLRDRGGRTTIRIFRLDVIEVSHSARETAKTGGITRRELAFHSIEPVNPRKQSCRALCITGVRFAQELICGGKGRYVAIKSVITEIRLTYRRPIGSARRCAQDRTFRSLPHPGRLA